MAAIRLVLGIAPHSKSVAKRRRISKYYSATVRAQNMGGLRIVLRKKTS